MSHLTQGPYTFQFRRGTASEWNLDNPILHAGEPGFESDTGRLKMGDGVHAWTALEYFLPGSQAVSGVVSVDARTGIVTLADRYAALVHAHAETDVTGLVADLAGKAATVHTHAAADVNSGTFAIGRIPTGTSGSTVALGNHTHPFNPAPVDLTPGATVNTDASLSTYFRLAAAQNFTLANPTNMIDGQRCLWEIKQDPTGSRLITLGNAFIFGADFTSITLSTAPNKRDLIGAIYNATLAKWLVTAFTKGF